MQVKCDSYVRVVGYYAPTKNFNKGKEQELESRKYYSF